MSDSKNNTGNGFHSWMQLEIQLGIQVTLLFMALSNLVSCFGYILGNAR